MEETDEERELELVTLDFLPSDIKWEFNSNDEIRANYFFRECLKEQDKYHIHRAHFIIDPEKKSIIAYTTLAMFKLSLRLEDHKDAFHCPLLWVSNFAVDKDYEDQDIEIELLVLIHAKVKELMKDAGCRLLMIEVHQTLHTEEYIYPDFLELLEKNGFDRPSVYSSRDRRRDFQKKILLEKWVYDLSEKGGWPEP